MRIKLLILNLIVNIVAKAVVVNPVAAKPVAVNPVAVNPAVLNLQSKIKACKNVNGIFNASTGVCDQSAAIKACTKINGTFGPLWPATNGVCDQSVARNTCTGSAVRGSFNTATGSCSSQTLGSTCTSTKGVFSYNYNSDYTAIFTKCDQSVAIATCKKNADPLTIIDITPYSPFPFNPTTGSCNNQALGVICTGSQQQPFLPGVFSYNYNSDNTAITASCDQSVAIRTCEIMNGVFGPLWPATNGVCDQSAAIAACGAGCQFNNSTGSCNCNNN